MAASPVFTSAASGRPFVLLPEPVPLPAQFRDTPKLAALRWPAGMEITPASRIGVRPAPEMVSSGIPELDALTGGWPRGCLSETCGPASSGRTSIMLSALVQATQRGEACALVDASDALDPASAVAAGVEMGRLLWVRCGKKRSPLPTAPREQVAGSQLAARGSKLERLEQVLKITDLLLRSNGFGMIVLDLADIPVRSARRIPLASWFRFRRVVEHTPTVLLVIEQQPIAGSCSSVLVKVSGVWCQVSGKKPSAFSHQASVNQETSLTRSLSGNSEISRNQKGNTPGVLLSHTGLLDRFEITAERLRSRLDRKPSQAIATFRVRAKWAG